MNEEKTEIFECLEFETEEEFKKWLEEEVKRQKYRDENALKIAKMIVKMFPTKA